MKPEQLIKNLIKQGESDQLEFKEVVQKDAIAKALCAFLNGDGGTVLIGVKDNGEIIGLENAGFYEAELRQYLFQSILPEPAVTVSIEQVGAKEIISIKVWEGSKPPYLFNGEIFFRKGSNTVKASSAQISKLIAERQKSELHWERQTALGADLDDLDELEIRKTIQDLTRFGRGKLFSEKEIEDFLSYYGLYRNGHLTNAAIVLFAKEPARFLPQCRIRLTVFKSSKTSEIYSYDKIFDGNLFRNIEEVLQFFEVNIATVSKFSEKKWLREDITYPKLAIREGLMNALIHRDYADVSGTAHVAFYPNRLEISNSGSLYGGYTPRDLAKNHLSVPRNPDIAHICFLRQLIEKIGRGTVLMIEDCANKGFGKPKWITNVNSTTVTFPDITVSAKEANQIGDAVIDAVNDAVSEDLSSAVKERLVEILVFVSNEKGVKVNDLVEQFDVSERTIKENLKTLIDAKLLVYSGSKKTGNYQLTPEFKNKLHD